MSAKRKPIIDSLQVGPFPYKVEAATNITVDGESKSGTCDSETLTIQYDAKLAPARAVETILHEAVHALLDFTCLDNDVPDDEQVTVRLSPALALFVRDNPSFIQLLMYGVDSSAT
jgi:hypothetical protein